MMKFIVLCFLFTVPASLGLSSLLEMSQVLWTKLLNGGLSNIGPLDPLRVPIVKVDQSQGRISYRMVLSNIEILGLNDSSLESIHVGRGSVKSNLSEHEAGYVSYNDRNAIDYIRYRFHTVVKEPNDNQRHSEDLTVEPLEKYRDTDAPGARDSSHESDTERKSNRYQENQQKYSGDDTNRRFTSVHQQEQPNPYHQQPQQHQYHQTRGQDDFVPRRESNHHQESQHRNNDDDHNRRYANVHQHGQQNQYPQQHQQHQQSREQDDFASRRQSNQHQQHQPTSNDDDNNRRYVNIYQEGQRNQYQERPQQQDNKRSRVQDDSVPHRESTASQGNSQRPYKRITYDENNYEKHQQIPRIDGFKSTTNTRNLDNRNNDGNHGERSYLVYAQTQNIGNDGNGRNNYRNEQRSRENYEQFPSKLNAEVPRDVEFHPQTNGKVEIKYPARLSNNNKPCADAKHDGDAEVIGQGQFSGNRRYQGSSMRLENQPGYIDIVYADENSKKLRHFGAVHVEPRGDKNDYSLEDIRKDLENHRRFIIHNFTDSELSSRRNDRARTTEETKRIKDMVRYAKEFQENQGFFEEGMELIYHYGNGSEAKVYDGKRTKREHLRENENDDDIMHVIMKIRVPLLNVKADYVLMGKVGEQVLRGNGELNGNFTELIGDFTVELKKSSNNTLVVRAARAKLVAASQNIELQGMDEKGAVNEILTQGLMAAEAVAAMLADDLATKALNESTTDAIIYKMYKELPAN